MEELTKYLKREAGVEDPQDVPVEGDIADLDDLGFAIEKITP